MISILQINAVVSTGSTGKIATSIGDKILEKGWKSYIAYGRYGRSTSSELIRIGSKIETYQHLIDTRLFGKHGESSIHATKRLIKTIHTFKPDIIHLHNIHGYYINIELLFDYIKTTNIPLVWTLHDCWSFTGHCTHFEHVDCQKWKTLCHHCPIIQNYPASLIIDRSEENYILKKRLFTGCKNAIIVPVSNWLENLVKQSFLKDYNIQTIPNGIDLNMFKPKKGKSIIDRLKIPDLNIILGVASLWDENKGLEDFKKLSKMLFADEIIVLVGLTKKQIQSLPNSIIGIERTENIEDLVALYNTADVFLNLTYADTYPTTNLESIACGTPVITYATGGSIEVIKEYNGRIVKQGDIDGVLETYRSLKALQFKDKYMAERRAFAEMYFDDNKQFSKYIDLYTKLLEAKKSNKNSDEQVL